MKLNLAAMSIFIGAVSATTSSTSKPTSSKANKLSSMMSGKSGKGGKAGAKVYNNFISRAVPIREQDYDGTSGISDFVIIQSDEEDPVVEVRLWCWDDESDFYSNIDVYVDRQANEDLKVYGQVQYCYNDVSCTVVDEIIPMGTDDEERWFTLFEKYSYPGDSGEPNNSPDYGAITIVGQETGRRWYIGLDGSSFLSTLDYSGPHLVCDFSGIIKTNFANTLADPFYVDSSGNGSNDVQSLVSESPKHFKGNL